MQNIKYTIPTCNDTAVCLCFFSPVGFIRPKMNFLFIESMLKASHIPVFTVECVIKDQVPLLENPTLQVKSNSLLFYKEHLYNLLVPKIPEQYTKLVFLDADILFDCPNWVDEISKSLDTHDAVQPFSLAHWLNVDYKNIVFSNKSTVYALKNVRSLPNRNIYAYHPGFVWAMKRDLFNKIGGFFDKCLFGTGDSFFSHMWIINETGNTVAIQTCPLIDKEYIDWLVKVNTIPKTVTYLPFTIYHLYHGSLKNRQYDNRYDNINRIIKPNAWDTYFTKNKDGVYETNDIVLSDLLLKYFTSRYEDECEILVPKLAFRGL